MDNLSGTLVPKREDVVRLIHQDWVVNGILLRNAFMTAKGETYLSVNRPAVKSYESDVLDFISNHPQYLAKDSANEYYRGRMNVGEISIIEVSLNDQPLNVSVEVEPRNAHYQSHAGIFVRSGDSNIVSGRPLKSDHIPVGVSSDDILQEVQWALRDFALLECCALEKTSDYLPPADRWQGLPEDDKDE